MFRLILRLAVVVLAPAILVFSTVQASASTGDRPKIQTEWEEKLLGNWVGGPCMGSLHFSADGTFQRRHYSPGDNEFTGTWTLKPGVQPKLTLTVKASDDPQSFAPGKIWELGIVRLDADALSYQYADGGSSTYHRKSLDQEAAELLRGRIIDATVAQTIAASESFENPMVGDTFTLNLAKLSTEHLRVIRESSKTKAVAMPISSPLRVVGIHQGKRSERPGAP
jgi:hypothetical protein